MLTSNLDTSDGLVNGVVDILKKISYGTTGNNDIRPNIAWLKFKDNSVGVKRQKNDFFTTSREGGSFGSHPIRTESRKVLARQGS